MQLRVLLAASLLASASVAVADEVWDSNVGRIVYTDEIGPTAVFSYHSENEPGVIYVLGLAKVYQNRGLYEAYWAKNKAKVACETERPGLNGKMTRYWGRLQVKFIDSNFPSRWEGTWSYCNGKAEAVKIEATPGTPERKAKP